jgi:hypothetical protein
MSLLPSAHAGQSFGSRRIDFFTVSGQVTESEAHTGHVKDTDGMDHEVKLMEQTSALAPGDTATVLRVQSGPNRRSRPVAIINHSRGIWMRATPDATTILAKAGVTRSFNWWLSFMVLIVLGAASVWPVIHQFLTVIASSAMASIPVFDVFADIAIAAPELASWRLEAVLPTGVKDALAALNFIPMNELTEWGLAMAASLLAILAFLSRSWRLIYIPAFAALAVFSGAVLGGAMVTISMLGGAIALFMIGGLVNRVRDGGRFNSRVDRLAEHVMRHPPQESIIATNSASPDRVLEPAAAAATIATATALAHGEDDAPAPAETSVEKIVADNTADSEEWAEPVEIAASSDLDVEEGDLPSIDDVAAALALNNAETSGDEIAKESDAPTSTDRERTMEVAAPPPMVSSDTKAAADTVSADLDATSSEEEPNAVVITEPVPEIEEQGEPFTSANFDTSEIETSETPINIPEPVAHSDHGMTDGISEIVETADPLSYALADDPVLDGSDDPMMEVSQAGDFAPGAPEVELDK